MTALAFTIVAIMLIGGLLLACAIIAVVYFGVSAARPELLRRDPPEEGPPS